VDRIYGRDNVADLDLYGAGAEGASLPASMVTIA